MQRMEAHLSQRLEQRMKLSPQMVQNLQMLQMPVLELRDLIVQELQENPALDLREDVEEPDVARDETPADNDESNVQMEILESLDRDRMEIDRRNFRLNTEASDRKQEFLQNQSAPDRTLREHLKDQLLGMEIDGELRGFAEHIIESIDDNGYLSFPLDELLQSLPEDLRAEAEDVLLKKLESALAVIQKMDPRGVGARNTNECLLLQLEVDDEIYPLLRHLIEHHIEDISRNRLPRIAKEMVSDPHTLQLLGYDTEVDPQEVIHDLKFLIGELSKLQLHPGANFSARPVPRVMPEVVIRQVDGKYVIFLDDGHLPRISLNAGYQEMIRTRKLNKEESQYLRQKVDAGKKLIHSIEHRRSTIYRITEQILDRQMDFFENGIEHLRPLKMQDVADTIGVHVSTVSRAISEKWVETPRGIFPLKYFFPSPAAPKRQTGTLMGPAAPGGEPDSQTRLVVKEVIREIIDGEDRKKPLSDIEIAKILKDKGFNAARRTVAKYREELNIPSSRIRQEF